MTGLPRPVRYNRRPLVPPPEPDPERTARRVKRRRDGAAFLREQADRLEADAADCRARADRMDAQADELERS